MGSISTKATGTGSIITTGFGLPTTTGAGTILSSLWSRKSSLLYRRNIFTTCHPDITGYTTMISMATGGHGIINGIGTVMIGISMRGGMIYGENGIIVLIGIVSSGVSRLWQQQQGQGRQQPDVQKPQQHDVQRPQQPAVQKPQQHDVQRPRSPLSRNRSSMMSKDLNSPLFRNPSSIMAETAAASCPETAAA